LLFLYLSLIVIWPCEARRILPSPLFESCANFIAASRARVVDASIMAGLTSLRTA
jgi:hypothetical protein